MPPKDFRKVGARLSNWSRWGDDDTIGTLNLITPKVRARAMSLVVSGVTVPLGLEVGSDGPQPPGSSRSNPIHIMTRTGASSAEPGGFVYTDDLLFIHTQSGTQVDGLAHVTFIPTEMSMTPEQQLISNTRFKPFIIGHCFCSRHC